MQINSSGSITGAVGTQQLWIWEAGSAAPILAGPYGGGAGFVSDRLMAAASNSDVAGNPSGIIHWVGSPATTTYQIIDRREANFLRTAGDYWLATAAHATGYATWGQIHSGAVEWNPGTGDAVAALALQADGSCVVGDQDGNREIRWADGAVQSLWRDSGNDRVMADDLVLCRDETAQHVVLYNRDGEVVIRRLVGQSWPLAVIRIGDIPWICYTHADAFGVERVVFHPYNDATTGVVVTTSAAFGLAVRLINNTLHFAWGLTAGEAFNGESFTDHIATLEQSVDTLSNGSLAALAGVISSGAGGGIGATPGTGTTSAPIRTPRVFRPGLNDPSRGAGAGTLSEVPPSYNPRYPFNNVLAATEAGHLFEIDDTPGAERVHLYHRSGSHVEMQPNGTVKYKTTKLRQDVTIGDHEMIIRGDWTITVDGSTKLYVRNGSLEIQADNGAAINVKGEMKVHADNILLKAKQKISLSAPFVDIGSPTYMSLPANIATLYGVPIPIAAGLKPPAFSATSIAKLAVGTLAPGIMAAEALKFVKFGQGTRASLSLLKTLPRDTRTNEPIIPEIDQPEEIPLSSPGMYTGSTPDNVRRRDRQFDTPEDVGNTEAYSAHLNICDELKDFVGVSNVKDLPGQVFASDTTVPSVEPHPTRAFVLSGTVSCVTGNATVVGVGTTFTSDVRVGDTILVGNVEAVIASVPNDTQLVLTLPWSAATISSSIYVFRLRPFAEFFQRYTYTDQSPLGQSGLVVRDVMRGFVRPIVERQPVTTSVGSFAVSGTGSPAASPVIDGVDLTSPSSKDPSEPHNV